MQTTFGQFLATTCFSSGVIQYNIRFNIPARGSGNAYRQQVGKQSLREAHGRARQMGIQHHARQSQLITAYQPCKTEGPTTAYQQQWSLLRARGINKPDPQQALIDNLDTILLSLTLIDLHVHKHGTQDEPATYNRGTKRINLALGTPTIAAEMTAIGYKEFNAGPFSDHRSLFVDVKVQNILLGNAVNMVPAKHRVLRSKDPKLVKEYRGRVLEYFDEHQVIQRYTKFRSEMKVAGRKSITEAEQQILNGMDNNVTRAMLSAEKAGERKFKHPWVTSAYDSQTNSVVLETMAKRRSYENRSPRSQK